MKTYKQNGWDVPEGWVLVPVEPTPAMTVSGVCVSEAEHDPAGVYQAMLSAAPQPPAKPGVSAEPIGYVSEYCLESLRSGCVGTIYQYEADPRYTALYARPANTPDAQAIRDAERYRWLVKSGQFRAFSVDISGKHTWASVGRPVGVGANVDEAIDASMQQGGAA